MRPSLLISFHLSLFSGSRRRCDMIPDWCTFYGVIKDMDHVFLKFLDWSISNDQVERLRTLGDQEFSSQTVFEKSIKPVYLQTTPYLSKIQYWVF